MAPDGLPTRRLAIGESVKVTATMPDPPRRRAGARSSRLRTAAARSSTGRTGPTGSSPRPSSGANGMLVKACKPPMPDVTNHSLRVRSPHRSNYQRARARDLRGEDGARPRHRRLQGRANPQRLVAASPRRMDGGFGGPGGSPGADRGLANRAINPRTRRRAAPPPAARSSRTPRRPSETGARPTARPRRPPALYARNRA